jgi:hypothetical protein
MRGRDHECSVRRDVFATAGCEVERRSTAVYVVCERKSVRAVINLLSCRAAGCRHSAAGGRTAGWALRLLRVSRHTLPLIFCPSKETLPLSTKPLQNRSKQGCRKKQEEAHHMSAS